MQWVCRSANPLVIPSPIAKETPALYKAGVSFAIGLGITKGLADLQTHCMKADFSQFFISVVASYTSDAYTAQDRSVFNDRNATLFVGNHRITIFTDTLHDIRPVSYTHLRAHET